MALFDSILSEAAEKFGLGDKAAPLLSGLLALMTSEQTGGLAGFIDKFRQAGLGDLVSSWISTGSNQPVTDNQLSSVLGDNVINQLASKVGLSGPIATTALAFLVPRVIDLLTPNGTVPSGIPTAVSSFLSGGAQLGQAAAAGGSSIGKWLPLLLIPLLAILGYRYCNRPTDVTVSTPTTTPASSPAVAGATKLGEFIESKLPDGVTLKFPSLGVENNLIAFITDPAKKVDKETWFSFDRLEFDTASATLKPSSHEQLANIAAILKAYPNVNLKIGGYTDNTGNDAANLKLSTERAANTKAELIKLGVDKSRLESEGYGKEHPVADNATDEGRQRNRRIDVRVTKK